MVKTLAIIQQVEKSGWSLSPMRGGWRLLHPPTGLEIFMSMTAHWLCLSSPRTSIQEETTGQLSLAEKVSFLRGLLLDNERMFMTKISLSEDGSLQLAVENPLDALSMPMLQKTIGSFSRYASISEPVGESSIVFSSRSQAQTKSELIATERANLRHMKLETGIDVETFYRYMRTLEGSGWFIKKELQEFPWHIGFKGVLRTFEVFLTVTRNWASFQVPLLVDRIASVLDADLSVQTYFMEYLLRLNNVWFMAKLGINASNQLLLLIELPTETFDFSLLRLMTRTISTYINRYGQEIQLMASLQKDPRLIELLNSHVR